MGGGGQLIVMSKLLDFEERLRALDDSGDLATKRETLLAMCCYDAWKASGSHKRRYKALLTILDEQVGELAMAECVMQCLAGNLESMATKPWHQSQIIALRTAAWEVQKIYRRLNVFAEALRPAIGLP